MASSLRPATAASAMRSAARARLRCSSTSPPCGPPRLRLSPSSSSSSPAAPTTTTARGLSGSATRAAAAGHEEHGGGGGGGGDHGHAHAHEDHFEPPTGWLFGVRPGDSYQKEGWENVMLYGFAGSLGLAAVAYAFKPDTSIQTWALEEARRRLEAEGILEEPESK